jgi:hypothetical protein
MSSEVKYQKVIALMYSKAMERIHLPLSLSLRPTDGVLDEKLHLNYNVTPLSPEAHFLFPLPDQT